MLMCLITRHELKTVHIYSVHKRRGGEHEERAENLNSSQVVHDHLVAYHLAPAITDDVKDVY